MKKFLILIILLFGELNLNAQGIRTNVTDKIDTANLDLGLFARGITDDSISDFEKAKTLLTWLSNRLEWKSTDYKQRTVKEILARNGGNCFELAKVYMALIQELNIIYRPIAEINIHAYSDHRQETAMEKVKQRGNTMSVFGRQHNDHRWLEVYDSSTKAWQPVDPSMNVIGVQEWLRARVGFGERITLDTSITNDMIVPFAIFVTDINSKNNITENRNTHYLIDGFNALYGGKLASLPSWKRWVRQIKELEPHARGAFLGEENLHHYGDRIAELAKTYQMLKGEFKNENISN